MNYPYHFSCSHKTEGISIHVQVNDYYPLTRQEVASLLQRAYEIRQSKEDNQDRDIASIQMRLGQGIPGLMCPREIYGEVFRKQNKLVSMCESWLKDSIPVNDALIDAICAFYEEKK